MEPTIRERRASSEAIGWHRPWDAGHSVLRKHFLDQEAPPDRVAIARVTRVELIIEAAEKLRPTALVIGLDEQRPTPLICREELSAPLLEGSCQLVKHGIGSHPSHYGTATAASGGLFQ